MKLDLVDVFASGALSGNPLGVVHGGGDLTAEQMLAITRWLGFSETTFLLPPSDARADLPRADILPGGRASIRGPSNAG